MTSPHCALGVHPHDRARVQAATDHEGAGLARAEIRPGSRVTPPRRLAFGPRLRELGDGGWVLICCAVPALAVASQSDAELWLKVMKTDVQIGCTCGQFRGVARAISGSAGNRLICYCDDCQSFAEYLGRAADILDAHGGTDIFQMSPAHLQIFDGLESLTCVRLTPNGLLRWYALLQDPHRQYSAHPPSPFHWIDSLVHDRQQATAGRDRRTGSRQGVWKVRTRRPGRNWCARQGVVVRAASNLQKADLVAAEGGSQAHALL